MDKVEDLHKYLPDSFIIISMSVVVACVIISGPDAGVLSDLSRPPLKIVNR